MQENHYLVPLQQQGSKKDLEHHIVAYTTEDAEFWFVEVKDRLLDINNWNKYCPSMSAEFRLTDGHGLGVGRHARKNDLIRIDITGQGKAHPGGFEWVSIEAIEYDDYPDLSMETFAIRVRSVLDPLHKKNEDSSSAGDNGATFTLVIERRAAKLFGSYHARKDASETAGAEWFGLPDEEWFGLIKKILG